MSIRVDSSPLITGAVVVGVPGLGVLAESVPSTGEHGAGYLYASLEFPADAGKEVRGLITTWPTLGTLTAYEDSSFEYDGASDTFAFQMYVDGQPVGTPQTVTVTVGAASSVSSDLSGAYTIREAVSSDLPGSFTVRSAVSSDLSGGYEVLSANTVSSDLSGAYAVRGSVSSDLSGEYSVRSSVSADRSGAFSVRSEVSQNLSGGWTVRGAASSDCTGGYLIRGSVSADLSGSYQVGDGYSISPLQAALLYNLYRLHGLAEPLTVSPSLREVASLQQQVTSLGGATTIETLFLPVEAPLNPGLLIEELAALHGLTVPLTVTSEGRTAGTIAQSFSSAGNLTVITRQ